MVRLVAGSGVARCAPMKTQHATNAVGVQHATQRPAQQEPNPESEKARAPTQQTAQQARNTYATAAATINPRKLRALLDQRRRRDRVLDMLAANPRLRLAVIAEVGDPAVVGVAIRGAVYGEMEIPTDRYDAFALLELMQRYGAGTAESIH